VPLREARRHVERGAAQIIAGRLVFSVSAIARAIHAGRPADETLGNYDRAAASGLASLRAIAGLPMARPSLVLGYGQRTQGCGPLHRH
jgi:hypothetical protein